MITSNHDPIIFMGRLASDPKRKRKVTFEQIKIMITKWPLLKTMHQRSQYGQLMTQLIFYLFNNFGLKIKVLRADVCKCLWAQNKRKDGKKAPKRKQNTRVENNPDVASLMDLEQIANEAMNSRENMIENPNRLQRQENSQPQIQQRTQEDEENIEDKHTADFAAVLDSYGTIEVHPQNEPDISHPGSSQNSSSNSSKSHPYAIPNLAEKLKIFGDVNVTIDKRTVPKRGRNNTSTAATKTVTRRDPVIDLSTTLDDDTRILNPLDIPEEVIREKCRALDAMKERQVFENRIRKIADETQRVLFNPENLAKLKRYQLKKKGIIHRERPQELEHQFHHQQYPQDNEVHEMHQNQDNNLISTVCITTSQEEKQIKKVIDEALGKTFLGGPQKISLNTIQERTKKKKADVFMGLLWAAKNGDCILQQKDPKNFGEISMIVK